MLSSLPCFHPFFVLLYPRYISSNSLNTVLVAAVTVGFQMTDYVVAEQGGEGLICYNLRGILERAITITVSTGDGTASSELTIVVTRPPSPLNLCWLINFEINFRGLNKAISANIYFSVQCLNHVIK